MRRGRTFLYLALILILGLVAVAVFYMRFMQPKGGPTTAQESPTPVVDLVNVVVVTQRVPRGAMLDETLLSMFPIQRDLVIPYYFTDMAEVVGRRAKIDLEANMLLTTSMVVDTAEQLSATGSNAALSIPKGMVAVSIPISRLSSISYAPRPGDHVSVIVTLAFVDLDTEFQSALPNVSSAVLGAGPGVVVGSPAGETSQAAATGEQQKPEAPSVEADLVKITAQTVSGGPVSVVGRAETGGVLEETFYIIPSEKQRPRLVSQTLLPDAIVLNVGNFPFEETTATLLTEAQPTPQPTPEAKQTKGVEEVTTAEAPKPPDVITLIVTPQDAVTLNYLLALAPYGSAQLTLALRSAGDDTLIQTEAATLDFLLKQYNIPIPVKLPYGIEPRVDELIAPTLTNDIQPTPVP
jgi:pilus assembly protein CpaB